MQTVVLDSTRYCTNYATITSVLHSHSAEQLLERVLVSMNVRKLQKIFMLVTIRAWLTTNMKLECSNAIAYVFPCQMKCVLYLITSCTVLLSYFWPRLFLRKFRFHDLAPICFLVLSPSYFLCFCCFTCCILITLEWNVYWTWHLYLSIYFFNVLCFTCCVHKRTGQAFLVFTLLLCWWWECCSVEL